MPIYMVYVCHSVSDRAQREKYWASIAPTLKGHSVKYLAAYTPFEVLEGENVEGVFVAESSSPAPTREREGCVATQKTLYHGLVSDSGPHPPSERRSGTRLLALQPASIGTAGGKEHVGLIHDLSESGGMLFVRSTKFSFNDQVSLSMRLSEGEEGAPRTVTGRVVRVEPLDAGSGGPWRRKVAVHFDRPIPLGPSDVALFENRAKRLRFSQSA